MTRVDERSGRSFALRASVAVLLAGLLLLPCGAAADEWGVVKRADSQVNVREKRTEKSRITCRLKPGRRVRVDFLEGSWWAVFRLSETRRSEEHALGYVRASLLKPVSKSSMTITGDGKAGGHSR